MVVGREGLNANSLWEEMVKVKQKLETTLAERNTDDCRETPMSKFVIRASIK